MTLTHFEISPKALRHRLQQPEPLVLLDVREPQSLGRQPHGIRGAIPIILKQADADVPDIHRGTELVVYCLSEDGLDSRRVIHWLSAVGYYRLWRLEGGLAAWQRANLPTAQILFGARARRNLRLTSLRKLTVEPAQERASARQPGFLSVAMLPLQREVTVICLGLVQTLKDAPPAEEALKQVELVMRRAIDVGARYGAEVRDFEGEEVRLYFPEIGGALAAAFELRRDICRIRLAAPETPLVRLALDSGRTVLGRTYSEARVVRYLIGSPISMAVRILKQAPPGGIAATERVIKLGRACSPALAARFSRSPNRMHVRTGEPAIPVFLSLPDRDDLSAD